MSTLEVCAAALLGLTLSCAPAIADAAAGRPDAGVPVSQEELSRYFAIQPDGAGLPAGRGTALAGATIFDEKCAACHGDKLQGVPAAGAAALVGGRGTLTSAKPMKTVESYWPYATTLYDYISRAMPFTEPGSLKPDEVYSLVSYILVKGGIIGENVTLDATSLPKVEMPNVKNFYDGRGLNLQVYNIVQDKAK